MKPIRWDRTVIIQIAFRFEQQKTRAFALVYMNKTLTGCSFENQ